MGKKGKAENMKRNNKHLRLFEKSCINLLLQKLIHAHTHTRICILQERDRYRNMTDDNRATNNRQIYVKRI